MSLLTDWVKSIRGADWKLWRRQTVGILLLELRRNAWSRRAFFVYLLALAPVLLTGLRAIAPPVEEEIVKGVGGLNVLYAIVYRTFFLRMAVFFGCVGVFTRLIRGDVLERTLHYYLLCPVRRDVLVVGKFLAGWVSTTLIFGAGTAASFLLLFLPSGKQAMVDFLLGGPGLWHLGVYLGVTSLACLGYGAVFLLVGLFFRNPIVPAAMILGWEYINFLLPPLLKKFSVIYYLESLCPVAIPSGPVTILAEPAPLWLSLPGLLGVTGLILLIAAFRMRQMEISYGDE